MTEGFMCSYVEYMIKWDASSRWSFRPISPCSSIETTTIRKTHPTLIVDWLGCRSKISITTFFQIFNWNIQIGFIVIFRFERFYTSHVTTASFLGFPSCIQTHSLVLKGCGGVKEFNLRLIKGTSG